MISNKLNGHDIQPKNKAPLTPQKTSNIKKPKIRVICEDINFLFKIARIIPNRTKAGGSKKNDSYYTSLVHIRFVIC